MKAILFSFSFLLTIGLSAQVTYSPYTYSNVDEFTVKKISIDNYYTTVELQLYTTRSDYEFFFHQNMYIQKSNDIYSKKYYVRSFVNNELHTKYKADPYTTYNFTLKFQKIPAGMTKINIIEPYTEGYTAWYWKNISINNSSPTYYSSYNSNTSNQKSYKSSSSMGNFFKYVGVSTLAGFAHPSNTYQSGYYNVYNNYVDVEINYNDGLYTKLRVYKKNGFFTDIKVMADNDFPPPFFFASVLKEIADEAIQYSEDEDETKNRLEEELGKAFYEFDGVDIALFLLNLKWLDY